MVHLSVLHQKVIAVNEIVLYRGGRGWEEEGSGRARGETGEKGRGGKGRGGQRTRSDGAQRGDCQDITSDNVTYQ